MKKIALIINTLWFISPCLAQTTFNSFQLRPNSLISLPSGANPSSVAIGDFNSDNRADLAVLERGLNRVDIFLQTSNGTFSNTISASYFTAASPSSMVATMLDNENTTRKLDDLVIVSGQEGKLTLLRNNNDAQGTFSAWPTVNFGTTSYSVNPQLTTAFLDRDEYLDIAYTYDSNMLYKVGWLQYQGAGTFRNVNSFAPNVRPTNGLALADFNRDGNMDLALPQPSRNSILTLLTPPGPSYKEATWLAGYYNLQDSEGTQPVSIAAGDVNYDLLPDLAVANQASSQVVIFLNATDGQFLTPALYPIGAPPSQVLLKDLNRDGQPEMLVLTTTGQVQLFRHTGAIGSTRYGTAQQTLMTSRNPLTMQVGDLNGDSYPDLVVACPEDNTIHIFHNVVGQPLSTHNSELTNIAVYPNPATQTVHVQTTMTGPLTVTLIDAVGRAVRQQTLNEQKVVAVDDLARGIYILQVQSLMGTTTRRVLLQ